MGEIGINHHTALYDLKLWQILSIIRGYRRKELGAWRTARWQTWLILCGMGAKDLHSPDDLLELPGDGELAEREEISDDEYQATLDLIRHANAKK